MTPGANDQQQPDLVREVRIDLPDASLVGDLGLPRAPEGLVLFAHGSGSSRLSERNRRVAAHLRDAGLGTLLFDLLTPDEERNRDNVFDVGLLAERLKGATRWLRQKHAAPDQPIGYFGASTGAAAALLAAADLHEDIAAVVSRGGRPDLAEPRLDVVRAPTLLIVGGADDEVLELNRSALRQLGGVGELIVIPGATHLFEEPGALDEVAGLARDWLTRYFAARRPR